MGSRRRRRRRRKPKYTYMNTELIKAAKKRMKVASEHMSGINCLQTCFNVSFPVCEFWPSGSGATRGAGKATGSLHGPPLRALSWTVFVCVCVCVERSGVRGRGGFECVSFKG